MSILSAFSLVILNIKYKFANKTNKRIKRMNKLLLATLAASLLLCACNKDEKEQIPENQHINAFNPPRMNGLDAAYLLKIEMYCMEYKRNWVNGGEALTSQYNEYASRYGDKFTDYKTLGIYVGTYKAGNGIANAYTTSERYINDMVMDWFDRRVDFMREEWERNGDPTGCWPTFYTAYVNGDVRLTCDKVLFGQQPGEDLSGHCKVRPSDIGCLPIGRENPKFLYGYNDHKLLETGVPMTDFFKKDTWVQFAYLIGFMEEPTERYDDLTFTLTLPTSVEHVREFCTSKYEGKNAPMRVTDTTFTASFKAKFNWE